MSRRRSFAPVGRLSTCFVSFPGGNGSRLGAACLRFLLRPCFFLAVSWLKAAPSSCQVEVSALLSVQFSRNYQMSQESNLAAFGSAQIRSDSEQSTPQKKARLAMIIIPCRRKLDQGCSKN
ncbi:unnamed protein product [Urochloa humidicola]